MPHDYVDPKDLKKIVEDKSEYPITVLLDPGSVVFVLVAYNTTKKEPLHREREIRTIA